MFQIIPVAIGFTILFTVRERTALFFFLIAGATITSGSFGGNFFFFKGVFFLGAQLNLNKPQVKFFYKPNSILIC
jgi:hypothetical protein